MSEDSEKIGGISVSIGGSDAALEAALNAAEAKIKAWVAKVQADAKITVSAATPTSKGGGGGGAAQAVALDTSALEAKFDTLIKIMGSGGGAAAARQRRVEAEQVTINGVKVGRLSNLGTSLQKAIGPVEMPVEVDTDEAEAHVQNLRVETAKPVAINLDIDAAMADIKALTAAVQGLRESLSTLPAPAAQTAGGGRQRAQRSTAAPTAAAATSVSAATTHEELLAVSRDRSGLAAIDRAMPKRKNLRDQSVGTEVNQRRVYTYEPESPIEQQTAEARSLRSARAAGDTRAREVDSDTTSLIRSVGGTLTRLERQGAQDQAAARQNQSVGARSRLEQLTAQAEAENATAIAQGASGFAPRRTGAVGNNIQPQQRPIRVVDEAAANRQRAEGRRYQREYGGQRRPPTSPPPVPNEPYSGFESDTSLTSRSEERFTIRQRQAEFRREVEQARIQRAQQQAIATQEAQQTAAGRTARTSASSLGGFFFGPRRGQIEAQAELNAARQQTASASKYRAVFENEIIANEVKAQTATKTLARDLRDTNKAIQESTEYKEAIKQQAQAFEQEAAATAKLEKFSTGAGTAVRSIAAVTVAGAAFGIGLKAIDTVLSAVVPAVQELVDVQTGFGATSTRVTTDLGKQTIAMRGNVDAVLAGVEAQAGLSDSSAKYLDTQLRLTTQIKAAAQAQAASNDLFKAGAGVGNAPSGLYGGYGGIGGTALLAQQLGGGTGFTEGLLKGVSGLARPQQGPDLLGDFNRGVQYLTNQDVRRTVNNAGFGGVDPVASALRSSPLGPLANLISPPEAAPQPVEQSASVTAYLNDLNEAGKRAADAVQGAATASASYSTNAADVDQAVRAAAQAGDVYGVSLAQQYGIVLRLNGAVVEGGEAYKKAAELLAQGKSIVDTATLGRSALAQEQQRQRESAASADAIYSRQRFGDIPFRSSLQRQGATQIGTIMPAQAALANLAAPPTPVGTGIKAADSSEARKIAEYSAETVEMQDTLNAYYAKGRAILQDTYKPAIFQTFGAAGVAAFDQIIGQITTVGAQMAKIQAGISNEQAAYQTAQYNYQLFIAKRTLSDIAGLTNHNFGVGKSELGVLEGQNLALSRQAQQLQFMLSQRQINLQTAIAGFVVPGLTPAEQNARVEEAKIEASYAQKQLNIQKQMFGNQVKIVDIQNLRQGADLLKQIDLLKQGRAVTLDTQLAQEKLVRLNEMQQKLTAEAGVYINTVNQQIAKAEADMTEIEAATGQRITRIMAQGITAAYAVGNAFFRGISGGFLGSGAGSNPTQGGTSTRQHRGSIGGQASGFLGSASTPTDMTFGEAGRETVAVLRNPRTTLGDLMGSIGGGGGSVVNFFGGITVRTEADIDQIARRVTAAQGKTAALKGLRTPN